MVLFIKTGREKLVGGVEYLPAKVIPYDIPHDDDIAFLTCVYMTDAAYDYKKCSPYGTGKIFSGRI